MERVGASRVYSFASYLYSYIDALIQRVDEYAISVFNAIDAGISDVPQLRDVEEGICTVDRRERECESWGSWLAPIIYPSINLSTRQSLDVVHMGGREPHLFVKIPRRQICHFPEPMKAKLLNIEDDKLDLFFAIYLQEEGSKEFHLSVPTWAHEDYSVHVGFYGGDGVRRGSRRTVPWHFIREYNKEEARDLKVGLTDDVGAFMMGAFRSDCQGPHRGVGVYGLVLKNEGRGEVIQKILKSSDSLKDFVERAGANLAEIFTFNKDY